MFQSTKLFLLAVLATLATLLAGPASAAVTVDVADTVTDITAAATPIGLIGGAVLGVLVAVKIYKWVRRAM